MWLRRRAIRKGLKLNEYGLFRGAQQVAGSDEAGVYAALGLEWVVSALRGAGPGTTGEAAAYPGAP